MPRKESNAPTERILAILDDVASLEDYCREMEEKLVDYLEPEKLQHFPRRPSMEAVISERARQSIMLAHTRSKREHARRVRQLGKDHGIKNALSMKDLDL